MDEEDTFTITNVSSSDRTYNIGTGSFTLQPGEKSRDLTYCEAYSALNESVRNDTGISDLDEEAQRRGCFGTGSNITPTPGTPGTPSTTQPPPEGDSGELQGTQQVQPDVELSQDTSSNDEDPAPGEEDTRPAPGEPHPNSEDRGHEETVAAEPVSLFSGQFYLRLTDLAVPNTIMPLEFIRIYRSGQPTYGPFGWNWDHNYNLFLRELNTGDIVLWRELHEERFKNNGTSTYDSPNGIFQALKREAGPVLQFTLEGATGISSHFSQPAGWSDAERIPITSIRDRHGNSLAFSYDGENRLTEVRENTGFFLRMVYDDCGLLVAVRDHAAREYKYIHNEETQDLVCVTTPAIEGHPQGISRQYHYMGPSQHSHLRHNIVRITDEAGQTYLENVYEQDPTSRSFSRVKEQLFAGYQFQFQYTQLQWVPPRREFVNIPAMRVELMNPDYGLETYTFNYRGDLLDRRFRLQRDGSFRVVAWRYEYDEQGNLSTTLKPDGSSEVLTYHVNSPDPRARGNLLQKELRASPLAPAPSRVVWRGTYDPNFQLLLEEEDERGTKTRYEYDFQTSPGAASNSGKLIKVHHPDATLPDGTTQSSVTILEYLVNGQMSATILADGTRNEIVYGVGLNEKNRIIERKYDTTGINIKHKFTYDGFGYTASQENGNGNVYQEQTNALGLIVAKIAPIINGSAAEIRFSYDTDARVSSHSSSKGSYTSPTLVGDFLIDRIERDVLGYPVRFELRSNSHEKRSVSICRDFRGLPVKITNPDGSVVKNLIDERGLVVRQTIIGNDGQTMHKRKVYDRTGRLIRQIDTNGANTEFEYDGFSRLKLVRQNNGTIHRYQWQKGDLLDSVTIKGLDESGINRTLSVKTMEYDQRRRQIRQTFLAFFDDVATAQQVSETFVYDDVDRKRSQTNHLGGVRECDFDGVGRLKESRDSNGNKTVYTYDLNNNVIEYIEHHQEPDGSTSLLRSRSRYDERDRLIAAVEPDGAEKSVKLDDRDLPVEQIDALGIKTSTRFDAYGNAFRKEVDIGGLNISQQWAFDSMSRTVSYTDPEGQTSTYDRDGLGRVVKTTYPNGFENKSVYNSLGQRTNETLVSGTEMSYEYDTSGRLTFIRNSVVPAGVSTVPDIEFAYDGLDRMIRATSDAKSVERSFDSMGRLLREQSHGDALLCEYDDTTGDVTKLWPDGRAEKLEHDRFGKLTNVTESTPGTLGSGQLNIAGFRASGPNHIGDTEYASGLQAANSFDERKRVVETQFSKATDVDEKIKYRFDTGNKIVVESTSWRILQTKLYDYDNKSRLLKASSGFTAVVNDADTQAQHDAAIAVVRTAAGAPTNEEEFTYNSADARQTTTETGGAPKNLTYQPGYRLQSDGVAAYTHGPDGTRSSDASFAYTSDSLGRISRITQGGAEICRIDYDALGRPSVLHEQGKPVRTFNYFGAFVEQEKENGTRSRQFTLYPGSGVPIAVHDAGRTLNPLYDARLNLIAVANNTGNLVETYDYKSFGSPEIKNAAGATIPQSAFNMTPEFGGQRYLPSTGLYLSKRRLMDPVNGIYLSIDPRSYQDSPSLYVYAIQNPINNIDPDGEIVPLIIGVFVIGGAIAGAGYSLYDALENPNDYEGWEGFGRTLFNVFGGAAIGGASVVAGEAVLALGGTGLFASGTAATTTSFTAGVAAKTFALYGTSSVASGAILRGGFNALFPDHVDPISAGSVGTDFVAGGALGTVFRGGAAAYKRLTNSSPTGVGVFDDYFRFWDDLGGETARSVTPAGPYPTWLGRQLDRIGIRQGYASAITNDDLGKSFFGAIDTQVHEFVHKAIAREVPTFAVAGDSSAIALYAEELIAYSLGHAGAGRLHGVPFAPFEVANSMGGFSAAAIREAQNFWGRTAGTAIVAAAEQYRDAEFPNELVTSK